MAGPQSLEPVIKGVWFWDKRWWWVIAMNELIRRRQKDHPSDTVSISVDEINQVLHELAGSFGKRLRYFATAPARVSLVSVKELVIKP